MYSQNLQKYVQQIGNYAQVDPGSIALLEKSLACFMDTLGRAIGASTEPKGDLFEISVRLLLLSDGLAGSQRDEALDGAHYLVGLGFEQTGELLTRLSMREVSRAPSPLENDLWYRLVLAFLHYLAGGYRVQALSVFRHLQRITSILSEAQSEYAPQYRDAEIALRTLYSVKRTAVPFLEGVNPWYDLFYDRVEPDDPQELRLHQLAQQIRQRRDIVLANLGEGDEANWLAQREIDSGAADFWKNYLSSLDRRGITAFTREQVGEGFDTWLRSGCDLLVVLPTGSGKTVIGELRSALALAQGEQVLWMLPTRALVRQIKRELRDAFEQLDVTVDELPTTEDFIPLFAEGFTQPRHIAVTTPEKLASLLRSNPKAGERVGLVVFDEAQTLLKEGRGTTAEFVLQQIRRQVPLCDLVLMSAFGDIRDSLERILGQLGRKPVLLVSDTRPTRRVYGVITNEYLGAKQYPAVLVYPPGIQSEDGYTDNPFKLVLDGHRPLPARISPTGTAQRFVRSTTAAGLRTALFVQRVVSTETQAHKIARGQKQTALLPERDVARLRTELGRASVVEETASRGVAPHHAGLTPLEQTLVEKWVRDGIVKTVAATPTLAQGVNLPFDLSVVTYTTRSTQTETNKPLSPREILNMLGRAGRAGYVSDGLGLLSVRCPDHSIARRVLDDHRRIFFRTQEPLREGLGLSRLIASARDAEVGEADWLVELGGLSFSEVQSLTAFVLQAALNVDDIKDSLVEYLKSFPSVQQLEEGEVEEIAAILEKLAQNIQRQVSDDEPQLLAVLERTGMPIEVLRFFLSQLQSIDVVRRREATFEEQMLWADQVVRTALENCSTRQWYNDLVRGVDLERVFSSALLWRSGLTIAQLEANWQSEGVPEKLNRIELGRFLNHRLSLFAQFWGALAVACEEVYGSHSLETLRITLRRLPAFVREGVSSLEQLEWLRAIGGLDRVLAHKLARVRNSVAGRTAIRNQLWRWRSGRQTLPSELDERDRMALSGVLDLA